MTLLFVFLYIIFCFFISEFNKRQSFVGMSGLGLPMSVLNLLRMLILQFFSP